MSMNSATEKFLAGLKSNELLLKLTWDEWLAIEAALQRHSIDHRRCLDSLSTQRL